MEDSRVKLDGNERDFLAPYRFYCRLTVTRSRRGMITRSDPANMTIRLAYRVKARKERVGIVTSRFYSDLCLPPLRAK